MTLKKDIERIKREKSSENYIYSAKKNKLDNKTVSDMVEWIDDSDETYCEEEYNILIYRDKDGLLQSRRRHK